MQAWPSSRKLADCCAPQMHYRQQTPCIFAPFLIASRAGKTSAKGRFSLKTELFWPLRPTLPPILYLFAFCNLVIGSGAFVLGGIL
jgi:hypothetical protein